MQPTPEFENEIRAAMAVPDPDPAFLSSLRLQVCQPRAPHVFRLAWAALATSAAFLFFVIWLVGPGTVYAEFRSLLAFLPGIGMVQNDASLRVLAEPVKTVRDGISLEVLAGAADAQHTVLVFQVDGIPQTTRPGSETAPGCASSPGLQVADGSILELTGGSGNGWGTGYRFQATFPALPAGSSTVKLLIPCLMDTRPGSAPENWQIPLAFEPAPAGMQVFPVYDLTGATPTPGQATVLPAATLATESTPALGNEATANGIRISLEQAIETETGFLLQGSISKDPESMLSVRFGPGTQLLDANGTVIPVEFRLEGGSLQEATSYWGVETNSKAYPGPWKLHIPSVIIEVSKMVTFEVDLGSSPQVNQTWELDQPLEISGYSLVIQKISLTQAADQTTWLEFTFAGGPEIMEISSIGDPENRSGRILGRSRPAEGGVFSYALSYDQVPTGKRRMNLYGITVLQPGPWELGWQPPASAAALATPTAPPQACLTEATWQQMRGQPEVLLPAGLDGKLLVEESVGLLMPQISLVDLASGQKQPLAIGAWSSLSPDASSVGYIESDAQNILIAGTNGEPPRPLAGTIPADYNPLWSPDGQWIAFLRSNEGIYIIHPDGSGAKRLTEPTIQASLVGWMPDSRTLVIGVTGPSGDELKLVDIETGTARTALTVPASKSGFHALSPDGRRITFNELRFGKNQYSTWIANLDGAEKKLVADLESASTVGATWSPDGKWLVLMVLEVKQDGSHETPVLVQPETCQVAALPGVSGAIKDWR